MADHFADAGAEGVDLVGRRSLIGVEQIDLEEGAGASVPFAITVPRGLDDEVNVPGSPASVSPLANIRLVRREQLPQGRRSEPDESAEGPILGRREVNKTLDVATRLDDQSADTQRPYAVLDEPAIALKDDTAR